MLNVHGSCNHYKSSLLKVIDEINTYLLTLYINADAYCTPLAMSLRQLSDISYLSKS